MWDHEEKYRILTALESMRKALSHIAKNSDIICDNVGIIIDNQNIDAGEDPDDDDE